MVMDSGRPTQPVLGVLPMKRAIMAATLLALATSPCLAATKPAPPMTVTHIDGQPVSPLIVLYDLMNADLRSMTLDTAYTVILNVHGGRLCPAPASGVRPPLPGRCRSR